jgi:hypothetical protein
VQTMVVLVDLKEDVSPEDYERWVLESYLPAVRELPSVGEWRNHRITGLLGSDAPPPFRYVVTLEVRDPEGLASDMRSSEMHERLSELHALADVTQLAAERFV